MKQARSSKRQVEKSEIYQEVGRGNALTMSKRITNRTEFDLKFTDWISKIEGDLGKKEWITVYSSERNDFNHTTFYCALIPNTRVKKSLSAPSWDLTIGCGFPGFVFRYENGQKIGEYYRFVDSQLDSVVEPLVYGRYFYGMKEDYYEISEEFRHYFNLYEDRKNKAKVGVRS